MLFSLLLMLLGVLSLSIVSRPLRAEEPVETESSIDSSRFPTMTVSFICTDALTDSYTLLEDGVSQTILSREVETIAPTTYVAILLDIFRDNQYTVPDAVRELIDKEGENNDFFDYLFAFGDRRPPLFDIQTDHIGIFIPDADLYTPVSILGNKNFTHDINSFYRVRTKAFDSQPSTPRLVRQPTTALVALISGTLKIIDEVEPKSDRTALIIFSDGTDELSDGESEILLEQVRSKNIVVHAVFIPTYSPLERQLLEKLAMETGGITTTIEAAETITKTLQSSFAKQSLCHLSYRTSKAHPQYLIVSEPISNTAPLIGIIPSISIKPPKATILSPTVTDLFSVSASSTISVKVEWTLEEYPDRHIEQIAYQLRGPELYTDTYAPKERGGGIHIFRKIASSNLITGTYVLTVSVKDEFGLIGSNAVGVHVGADIEPKEEIPAPPTLREQIKSAVMSFFEAMNNVINGFIKWLSTNIYWLMALFFTFILLLYSSWQLYQARKEQAVAEATEKARRIRTAALVRIRTSPEASNLLQIVPLELWEAPENGDRKNGHDKNGSEATILNLPSDLYSPLRKWLRSAQHGATLDGYDAKITVEGDTFRLRRKPLIDPERQNQNTPLSEPISIQPAETKSSFELVREPHEETEYGPLQEGDILQFGEIHYKFMRLMDEEPQDSVQNQ